MEKYKDAYRVGDRWYYNHAPGDRRPEHLESALREGGWDWYRFYDGIYSSRFLAKTDGSLVRCTGCGYESPSFFAVRTHNRPGQCPRRTA